MKIIILIIILIIVIFLYCNNTENYINSSYGGNSISYDSCKSTKNMIDNVIEDGIADKYDITTYYETNPYYNKCLKINTDKLDNVISGDTCNSLITLSNDLINEGIISYNNMHKYWNENVINSCGYFY